MAITFRGTGGTTGADNANITPALFESPTAGDLLLCQSVFRTSSGTVDTPSGWNLVSGFPLKTVASHSNYLFWKVAAGADSSPSLVVSGGASGVPVAGVCCAFRGTDNTSPIGDVGTGYTTDSTVADIGPIPAVTTTQVDGAVVVIGAKNDDWTSVATLTGDGLTWNAGYARIYTPLANDVGMAMGYYVWSGSAPTLTDKSFVVTGGADSRVSGQMIVLIPLSVGQPTSKRWGGISFSAHGRIGRW